MDLDEVAFTISVLIILGVFGAIVVGEGVSTSENNNDHCTQNLEKRCYIADTNYFKDDARTSCTNHHDYYIETYTTNSIGSTACFGDWTKKYE